MNSVVAKFISRQKQRGIPPHKICRRAGNSAKTRAVADFSLRSVVAHFSARHNIIKI